MKCPKCRNKYFTNPSVEIDTKERCEKGMRIKTPGDTGKATLKCCKCGTVLEFLLRFPGRNLSHEF